MLRGPPVTIPGFAAATSGVLKMKPKEVGSEGSTKPWVLGFAKCGWLRTLKNSARNWTLTRSVRLVALTTEKSQLSNRGPRNGFRPAFPKVPNAGGVSTEDPPTYHPKLVNGSFASCLPATPTH